MNRIGRRTADAMLVILVLAIRLAGARVAVGQLESK
jgi:hypothetical protein